MLRSANYVYGKGMITEDTETGKYGFVDDKGNTVIPFEYDFGMVMQMVTSDSFKHIPTTKEIIQDSNYSEEVDEYVVKVVEVVLAALGIVRYRSGKSGGGFQEQGGLRDDEYSKVVSAIYTIVGEMLQKGDTKLIMYDYGRRNDEFEIFRERLSELTGRSIESFTSSLEKKIQEAQYFGRDISKLVIQKPVLYIGKGESYYQADYANENMYIKSVKNDQKII